MAAPLELEQQSESHDRWLITYADMITLLMVLFVVLYAGSVADAHKFTMLAAGLQQAFNPNVLQSRSVIASTGETQSSGPLLAAMLQDLQQLRTEVDSITGRGPSGGGVEMSANREGIVISLYGNLLFDSGKATINDDSVEVLRRVARILSSLPNPLRVEGHTDNILIDTALYPSNWELSTARGAAVVRHVLAMGISPARMQVVGYGDTHPLNPNDTREQRARNRRVDIQIIYPGATALTLEDLRSLQAPDKGEAR